ncbi:MAG: hypothetical protein FJ388_23205, partial [Verrucomicrobia bacterium]|nr:hypothetical protein [Verrucomicrobiota bacterium]
MNGTHLISLLGALCVLCGEISASVDEWKFDLGATDSPVAAGWTQLIPADAYTAQRCYGWTMAPEAAFSRDRYWNGELPSWHAPLRELPLDPLTRDGVASTKPMELR